MSHAFKIIGASRSLIIVFTVISLLLMETVSFAVLIPSVSLITEIETTPNLISTSLSELSVFALILLVCSVLIIKNLILIGITFLQNSQLGRVTEQISNKVFASLFCVPLTSEADDPISGIRMINVEVRVYVVSYFFQVIQLLTEAFLLLLLVSISLYFSSYYLLIALAGPALCIFVYQAYIRGVLTRLGQERIDNEQSRAELVHDALVGRTVYFLHRAQKYFFSRMTVLSNQTGRVFAATNFLQQIPRYVFEIFAGISILLLWFLDQANFQSNVIVIAVLIMRAIPSMAKMMTARQSIYASLPSVELLKDLLNRENSLVGRDPLMKHELPDTILVHGHNEQVISLVRGRVNIIIGSSGSGKTTILRALATSRLDLMGLNFEFQKKDGATMTLPKWAVNYMPQEVPIFSDTAMNNVTYNKKSLFDKIGEIEDLIRNFRMEQLFFSSRVLRSKGRDTISGGQRQRIAFLRSILNWGEINLFDEPTSALDHHLKKRFFETVNQGIKPEDFVLIVTHDKEFLTGSENLVNLNDDFLSI